MQITVNQLAWRIRIPNLNLDLVPKSCKFAVNQLVWRIRAPKLNLDFVPKSCKYAVKPGGLEDKGPKTEPGFCPKILQKQSKPGSLKDQDPIRMISKINFASWIRGFCRNLSHLFFLFRGSGSENCYFQNSFFWKSAMSLIFCLGFGPQPFPLTAAREPFFISKILSVTIDCAKTFLVYHLRGAAFWHHSSPTTLSFVRLRLLSSWR